MIFTAVTDSNGHRYNILLKGDQASIRFATLRKESVQSTEIEIFLLGLEETHSNYQHRLDGASYDELPWSLCLRTVQELDNHTGGRVM